MANYDFRFSPYFVFILQSNLDSVELVKAYVYLWVQCSVNRPIVTFGAEKKCPYDTGGFF